VWLTEGVEDGLAVMQMMQEPAWAVLGTSGFKSIELPAGRDWCDLLDDYEERAGILQFDFEIYRPDAEAVARQEVIDG